jgi:RNA dependent RNA polymerase
MEVFIRDVPEQVTENRLRSLLQPYMKDQDIKTYHCRKQRQRRIAFLIFLHPHDGNQFLRAYGQDKPFKAGPSIASKIQILSTPIFCVISNKEPNIYILKSLEKEEKDHKAKSKNVHETPKSTVKKEFRTSKVACGIWSYVRSDLVFVPYCVLEGGGSAKFGSRSLIVRFDTGKRIEFLYSNTWGITTENEPYPSFTLTLSGAPKFLQGQPLDSIDLLVSKTATLSVDSRKGHQLQRIQALTPHHEVIAGNCFVYRILLAHDSSHGFSTAHYQVATHIHALQKIPGLPPMIHQQIDTHHPRKSFASRTKELESMLANPDKFPHPWKLKFQIQMLVKNGILTPSQTLAIIPEVVRVLQRSGLAMCIASVQRFRSKIPFSGAETDAKDLELQSLVQLLQNAEVEAKSSDELLSSDGRPVNASVDMAMIHRVIITPASIYLYGPDAELMNRVLRKYPKHHEFFLRVLFTEEDGEPVRFNPRVSNDRIFNERFKSILRNGISISGRKYDFLGFSHSSLRAQACWFMAPFVYEDSLLYDRQLIQQLGDFTQIRCPAKCAARIGQAFSDTPTAVTFPPGIFNDMDDIERNDRVFSDGVGTMSMSVMRKIWKAVPSMRDLKPTCFQIRYRGAC